MEQALYNTYVDILKTQLVPAMGCTEPIAVAYAAALAARALRKADGGREFIRNVHICVSSILILICSKISEVLLMLQSKKMHRFLSVKAI